MDAMDAMDPSQRFGAGLSHHVFWVYVGIKQVCHGNAQFLLLGFASKKNKPPFETSIISCEWHDLVFAV